MTMLTATRSLTTKRLALLVLVAAGTLFLWTEHSGHVVGVLPYLLLLACPLMHLLHGGHHHSRHTRPEASRDD